MRIARDDRQRQRLWLTVPTLELAAMLIAAPEASAKAKFGALCQKEFQNGWLDTVDEAWTGAAGSSTSRSASEP